MQLTQVMRPIDVTTFQQAAELYNCIILVRQLNPHSLQYVGRRGYTPKSLYCKAKTANDSAIVPGTGQISRVAGLVADPTLPGMGGAFHDRNGAIDLWRGFLGEIGIDSFNDSDVNRKSAGPSSGPQHQNGSVASREPRDLKSSLYKTVPVKRGGFYTVQNAPDQPHYGALMYCPFVPAEVHSFDMSLFNLSRSCFIHGDYDLYGLVPADERDKRLMLRGQLLGQKNFYTPLLGPVEQFINSRIGTPMVQHGSQEHLAHRDDTIDIFWPDGRITQKQGIQQIAEFYKGELGNRDVGPSDS